MHVFCVILCTIICCVYVSVCVVHASMCGCVRCVMTTLCFSRLQNSDESFVVSSCEFICEVLLQDFPPELFLQRPLIAKVNQLLIYIYIYIFK